MALPRLPFARDAVSVAKGRAVLHRRLLTPLFHLRQSEWLFLVRLEFNHDMKREKGAGLGRVLFKSGSCMGGVVRGEVGDKEDEGLGG